MQTRLYNPSDKELWDSYVLNHPTSTHCHLSDWKRVIENTYGHKGYYLMAEQSSNDNSTYSTSCITKSCPQTKCSSSEAILSPLTKVNTINSNNHIVGVLPLIHIKSLLFGNHLVSMPFLNYGGILADNDEAEKALFHEAVKIGQELRVKNIELRHLKPLSCLNGVNSISSSNPSSSINPINPINYTTKTHKVRMLLNLPDSKEELLKSFKAKLRTQITRPQKEGMKAVVGGKELLNLFYEVFSINMRDLGSPVHSKRLFQEICATFNENARIGIVNYQNKPVAAGLIFCFRDTVEIPWASSLKEFNRLSPNMLLYWSLMEHACGRGFKCFDFGRSSPEEGTYKFKEQWGGKPSPMYWYYISQNVQPVSNNQSAQIKFEIAIRCWKRLPLPISNTIGPIIRKYISL